MPLWAWDLSLECQWFRALGWWGEGGGQGGWGKYKGRISVIGQTCVTRIQKAGNS